MPKSIKKPEIDVQTQIGTIELKPPPKPSQKDGNKDVNWGGDGKNFLQGVLTKAIQERNKYIHLHDDDGNDSDDWDD